MDVEHEAADRHRRIAAIVDDFVPVLVAQLGHVHPERDQHVERMARRHRPFGERMAESDGLFLAVALAEQLGLEQVEIAQLLVRRQRRMIGDVVGGADEIVEGKDQRRWRGWMIHDATGKFSSRWVLPDRNSLRWSSGTELTSFWACPI